MVDFVLDIVHYPYYCVFHAGYGCNIPNDIFEQINYKVIHELYPLTVLLPNDSNNGLVMSTFLHKMYQGNVGDTLINKIKLDNNKLDKIIEICPNFPK